MAQHDRPGGRRGERGLEAEAAASRRLAGDIVVAASFQLVPTLMEHGLADELRLLIFPVVLGDGQRLFGATGGKTSMRLVSNRTVGDSLALLTYQIARA